jgi:hypothetical protein
VLRREITSPRRLGKVVSLRDMIEFSLDEVALNLATLMVNEWALRDCEPHSPVPREHLADYAITVRGFAADCGHLSVPHTREAGERLAQDFEDPSTPWNALAVSERLRAFTLQFLHECEPHVWTLIDGRYAIYFQESAKPFGEEVYLAFADARGDIRDAGKALAVDLNTAAVFHAMRVAEHGLKWLAKRLRVKLTANRKPTPITEATWNTLIVGVGNKLRTLRTKPASEKRREQLQQCARANDHCDYMRELWRNPVSHGHKAYNALEAENAMNRVREFMQFLARMK